MKSTSLLGLPQKKVTTGLKKLQDAGISPDRWLAMLDADTAAMQCLANAWPTPGFPLSETAPRVYDAVALFGFGEPSAVPLPAAGPDEIVIRVGAWSLLEFRDSPVVLRNDLLWVQDWYERYPWCRQKLEPGVYRVRLPIPDSNRKSTAEAKCLLLPDENILQVCLGATTLAAHLWKTREDLLRGNFCRCDETLPDDGRR